MNANTGMTGNVKVKERPPSVRVLEDERMGDRVVDSYGALRAH